MQLTQEQALDRLDAGETALLDKYDYIFPSGDTYPRDAMQFLVSNDLAENHTSEDKMYSFVRGTKIDYDKRRKDRLDRWKDLIDIANKEDTPDRKKLEVVLLTIFRESKAIKSIGS